MAIVAFDNSAFRNGSVSETVGSMLITVTTGAVLIVGATGGSAGIALSAVIAGGIPLTKLGESRAGNSTSQLWVLTSPTAGVLTISFATAAAVRTLVGMIAASYTGAKGVAPFGTPSINSSVAVTTVNLSVSAATTNDMVVGYFGHSADGLLVVNNGITRNSITCSTQARAVFADIAGLAGAVTLSATTNAAIAWSFLGVTIFATADAAPGPTPNMFTRTMTGCGLKWIIDDVGPLPPYCPEPI